MEKSKRTKPVDPSGNQLIDRLDIALLITVIIFFVSAWAYLNGIICDFTGSEPINQQMSYIFVHYVLTMVIILCIVLTAIKSYYILHKDELTSDKEVKPYIANLFSFFLGSWFQILALCLLIILLSSITDYGWILWAIVLFVFISFKMSDLGYSKVNIGVTILVLVVCFPLFLSTMTSTIKHVEIETDKPFYAFSDKVLITVSARGYACTHKLVGLSEDYEGTVYYSEKGLIILNATQIKNNQIAIATIAPTTGLLQYISYIGYKMRGKEPEYMNIKSNDTQKIKKYASFTPKSIYIKP